MHRSSRFRRLALSLALLPVLSAMAQEAPPAATVEGARTYTPADFARYAPRNALDMLEQVPGFQIREADIERGLGEATGNVLINGQRVSGKSNDVITQLGKIPAGNVVRIEIRDGATLDIPGLSGQVANVVSKAGGISGQWSWNPDVRRFFTDPQLTRGEVSISGAKGGLDWTLGFANQANHSGAGGETLIYNADGSFRDYRHDEWTGEGDRPRLSGTLAWTGPTGQLANLNLAYQRVYFDYVEDGTRSGPGLPDRARSVRYEEGGYNHEIGGDYEFFARPEREAVRDAYGLRFATRREFESTFMYQAVASGEVDVISAFTSDGRIAANELLVLADPADAMLPYDAIVLIAPRRARDELLRRALEPLLPPAITWRAKRGLQMQLNHSLVEMLDGLCDQLLRPEDVRARGFFDPARIQALRRGRPGRHRSPKLHSAWMNRLWSVLFCEVWARLFLDRAPSAAPPVALADIL